MIIKDEYFISDLKDYAIEQFLERSTVIVDVYIYYFCKVNAHYSGYTKYNCNDASNITKNGNKNKCNSICYS